MRFGLKLSIKKYCNQMYLLNTSVSKFVSMPISVGIDVIRFLPIVRVNGETEFVSVSSRSFLPVIPKCSYLFLVYSNFSGDQFHLGVQLLHLYPNLLSY